jgi:hypothetical protein
MRKPTIIALAVSLLMLLISTDSIMAQEVQCTANTCTPIKNTVKAAANVVQASVATTANIVSNTVQATKKVIYHTVSVPANVTYKVRHRKIAPVRNFLHRIRCR